MALLYLEWLMVFMISNAVVSAATPYRRWCYYTNWSQYRNSPAKFTPSNIDPFLCTHISYAFAIVRNGEVAPFEWNDESTPWSKGMYEQVAGMKEKNSVLQIYLAIGGWNLGSPPFTQAVANSTTRSRFIDSAINLVRRINFDGIEIDWEYPAGRGSPPEDKRKFTLLLQELRLAVELEAASTNRPRLGLAAAVSAGKSKIDVGYEIPEISKALDIINLMAYDFHGSWDVKTGANSPLVPRGDEKGEFVFWNLESASLYWLQKGAPKAKLNIGVPTYGRTFELTDARYTGMGAPVLGGGEAGPYTGTKGFLAYYEICSLLEDGATEKWDDVQKVPYLFKDRLWAGYDNIRSLNLKVKWIMEMGFGGVMVWSLDLDDHADMCGSGPYPLINSIYSTLSGGNPIVTSPKPTPPAKSNLCSGRKDGFYQIQGECAKFVFCKAGHDTILPCSAGQGFDPVSKLCTIAAHRLCDATTPATITTKQPGNLCSGRKDGFYPIPGECAKFVFCNSGQGNILPCSAGQGFDPVSKLCTIAAHRLCDATTSATITTKQPGNLCSGRKDGFYPIQGECAKFVFCNSGQGNILPCSAGQGFDPVSRLCTIAAHHLCDTTAPATITTEQPEVKANVCVGKSDGFYPDPIDCHAYHICRSGMDFKQKCNLNQVFKGHSCINSNETC